MINPLTLHVIKTIIEIIVICFVLSVVWYKILKKEEVKQNE